ncbi:MAG TPA: hypothetical protein VGS11_00115 [Candidatus Bathyarchaeia archaeon]|nr:hypothetical protein [Candidatus Bathyarchaeia archaeon]
MTPILMNALRLMREIGITQGFELYPVIPNVQLQAQISAESGTNRMIRETLLRLFRRARIISLASASFGFLTSDSSRALRLLVDAHLHEIRRTVPDSLHVKSLLLHEILTELMVSFKLTDITLDYIDYVRTYAGIMPGFVTRNFVMFVDFVNKLGTSLDDVVVLTPLNALGYQMNPSKEACERVLAQTKGLNVVAMSVMAGGQLSLASAVKYIESLPRQVSCVVGVSSSVHARETFGALRNSFHEKI